MEKIFKKLKTKFYERRHQLENNWRKLFFYEYCNHKLARRKNILDIGCGIGEFLKLRKKGIFGVDRNIESLKKAQRYCDKLIQADILKLPFQDATFDAINCSHVIEHLFPNEAYQLLCEMNRVLRINATLIITSPTLWNGFFDDFTHVKPYYPQAIIHYLGINKTQTTENAINCLYKQEEIKWRYSKMPISSFLISKNSILNACIYLFVDFLNKVGFGKYGITGYTMVLRKLK